MAPMPNIASILKDEIIRLARKELRANTESLKKAVSTYRSEIAALKRRVEQLERQQKQTAKRIPAAKTPEIAESDGQHRWRAAGFAQHRKRLGLTAADMGRLLGVSSLSVYKWEGGQARPRAKYLPAIAALRSMGKREAAKRLENMQ
jgi:DNA-binding transcriptional regulator YiaG